MLRVKRVYEKPSADDGFRILVDRLWPRGSTKDNAKADLWLKEVAPSVTLRKWFQHDATKWDEFKKRYFKELSGKDQVIDLIVEKANTGTVTLLFGAKEQRYNNAEALKEYAESKIG